MLCFRHLLHKMVYITNEFNLHRDIFILRRKLLSFSYDTEWLAQSSLNDKLLCTFLVSLELGKWEVRDRIFASLSFRKSILERISKTLFSQ